MVNDAKVLANGNCECCGRPDVNPDLSAHGETLCDTCRDYVLAVEEYRFVYSDRMIED